VIALAFLAAIASDSWGQSKEPSSKASEQNTAHQERGTENSPIVVKILPSEKTETELKAEKEKQESDKQLVELTGDLAKYTKLLFAATAVLAVITAGLVAAGFFQVRDAKRSITAAEIAAKAAQAAAEHIPIVEGAFVYLLLVEDLIGDRLNLIENGQLDFGVPRIQIRLKNFGKTPAFIDTFRAHLSCAAINISGQEISIQPNTIIGAGAESPIAPDSLRIEISLPAEDATKVKDRSAVILLTGTLIYSDIWECKWTAPFDGRYDAEHGRFRLDNYAQQKNS
jgi:hypothetical protein